MNEGHDTQSSRGRDESLGKDEILGQIAFSYLHAIDRGESVDGQAIIRQYPQYAEELAAFIADAEHLRGLAGPLRQFARTAGSSFIFRGSEVPDPLSGASLPRSFGAYELLQEIGRGGMGVVYLARQRGLERLVALKMIHPGRPATLTETMRFRNEADAAALLDHPHIVPIYDAGEHQGQLYFTMKLIEGGNLVARARELPTAGSRLREDVKLVATLAGAIEHAHQRGVLHRDLKPSNILLDRDGHPYVADFGLAKHLGTEETLTLTGAVVGTPGYMSPEQVLLPTNSGLNLRDHRDTRLTTAADIYGMGAILYVLLTGRPPLSGRTPMETLTLVKLHEPVAPSRFRPGLDRDLEAVCLKCLEKDPRRRYRSAAELGDELGRWLRGEPTLARPLGRIDRAWRWCRRNPVLAAMTATAMALAVVTFLALGLGLVLVSRERNVADQLRLQAEAQASDLRLRLYAADLARGFRHAERGEIRELSSLLNDYADRRELHGFEWRYLRQLADSTPREQTAYRGHRGVIFGASYSPDGTAVATAGEDRSIQVWSAISGERKFTLWPNPEAADRPVKGHREDENCVRFSPDGRWLASAGEQGRTRLWDLETRQPYLLEPSDTSEVLAVAFSPDSQWLAAAGRSGVIRIWDTTTLRLIKELDLQRNTVRGLTFLADRNLLASAESNGRLTVWNVESGTVKSQVLTGEVLWCAASTADGRVVATGGDQGRIRLWQTATGELTGTVVATTDMIRSITISQDSQWLACGCGDGCVCLVSLADSSVRTYFRAHANLVWAVQFSPQSNELLTAGADRLARTWELNPLGNSSYSEDIYEVALSRRVGKIAASAAGGRLLVGQLSALRSLAELPTRAAERSDIAFSHDGSTLAYTAPDGTIKWWRFSENREESIFPPRPIPDGIPRYTEHWAVYTKLAFLTGDRLAAFYGDGKLRLWDGSRMREQALQKAPYWWEPELATAGTRPWLATLDDVRDKILLWNYELGKAHAELPVEDGAGCLAVHPDEQTVAVSLGTRIVLWDVIRRERLATLIGHPRTVTALAFAPDGKTLVSGCRAGEVRFWHLGTHQELGIFHRAAEGIISELCFSHDGSSLVVASVTESGRGRLTVFRASLDSEPVDAQTLPIPGRPLEAAQAAK